jgi:hypothetical protein
LSLSKEKIMVKGKNIIIENQEIHPVEGGSSGGRLQRDVAARDELNQELGSGGVTRVHKHDKPDEGDMPNAPNR